MKEIFGLSDYICELLKKEHLQWNSCGQLSVWYRSLGCRNYWKRNIYSGTVAGS